MTHSLTDLKRQTTFSIERLSIFLEDSIELPGVIVICQHENNPVTISTYHILIEIGIIFLTEEDNTDAEKILIDMLSIKNYEATILAYDFLSSARTLNKLSDKGEKILRDFEESDPRGKIVMEIIDECGLIE